MYKTLQEVIDKAEKIESPFFSPAAMSFFSSRLHDQIYGGQMFITSEQDATGIVWGGDRRWTIRRMSEHGHIDTIGEFGQYSSLADAIAAAQRLSQ